MRVGIVAALGAAARAVYVLVVARDLELGAIREGHGFVDPETLFTTGETVATANFPPLYPAVLALLQTLFGTSETVAQLSGAVLGAIDHRRRRGPRRRLPRDEGSPRGSR